jgi:hypothetical protein
MQHRRIYIGAANTLARRRVAADVVRIDFLRSRKIVGQAMLALLVLAGGVVVVSGVGSPKAAQAQAIHLIDASVVAVNIPGASAVAQIGTFLNVPPPGACANPIPSKFPAYIQPGAVLDPKRILVGSQSNFGAHLLPSASDRRGHFCRSLLATKPP